MKVHEYHAKELMKARGIAVPAGYVATDVGGAVAAGRFGFRRGGDKALVALAEMLEAPAYVNSGARGAFPFGHPLLGNWARSRAFAGADLVLAAAIALARR